MHTSSLIKRDYSYYRSVLADIPKPFAFLDLDLLDENIQDIVSRRGNKKIRIASKSIRCVGVLHRILSTAPEAFSGIMAFTAEEALYLSKQGFIDILIGYPVWNPNTIALLGEEIANGKFITFMVDSVEHIRHINAIGEKMGVVMPVCLDVDMSIRVPTLHFGVYRSPIETVEQAKPVVQALLQMDFVELVGVMGYEAQIAGVGDNYPNQLAKNQVIRQLKRRSEKIVADRRAQVVSYIRQCGIELRIVNGGGTGSLGTTVDEEVVNEITVGSGFYSPGLFDNYASFRYRPALGFAIEVVRKPRADMITCLGGGYVASGAAGKDKLPKPYLPAGLQLISLEGAGEVQTPFLVPRGTHLSLGDPVFMRHSKAGELCERFLQLHCVQNSSNVGVLSTYRGDGQCFL